MTAQRSVRPFTPADASAWVKISNPIMGRQTTAEALLAEIAGDAATGDRRWVAEASGEVVGICALTFFPFDPPEFLSCSVMVAPDQRGRGVGRALWQAVHAEAGRQGILKLAAGVSDTDVSSLAWAQRRGFTVEFQRFASQLDLKGFDEARFQTELERVAAQGVTFTDMADADADTLPELRRGSPDRDPRSGRTPTLAAEPGAGDSGWTMAPASTGCFWRWVRRANGWASAR